MNGEWLRVRPAELERGRTDPDWLNDLVGTAVAAAPSTSGIDDVAARRTWGTGKRFHALAFLLERIEFPINIITGPQTLIDEPEDPEDPEVVEYAWGFGPLGYLTADQVAESSALLATLTPDGLIAGVDPADLGRADVYAFNPNRPDELRWAVHDLPYVQIYFAAAAADGDALLCWID